MSDDAFAWAGIRTDQAEALAGDASTRRYFRVPGHRGSVILMLFADDEPSRLQAARFGQARLWLDAAGIPVPEILRISDHKRFYLLQDLGDVSLEACLRETREAGARRRYYEILIDYSNRIQASPIPAWLSGAPALNADLLRRELGFFQEHFLPGGNEASLAAFFDRLAAAAARGPLLPAHRDFHSRNVMLHDGRLYLLDFQDARYAHRLYDLASLVYDAYVDPGAGLVDQILAGLDDPADLPAVALQRNLKAIGTFAYQARRRGKSFYAGFIPRCLDLARGHLRTLGWVEELRFLEEAIS